MKKSRFSESQIISILKQAEAGTPVPELCREHGISSALFYCVFASKQPLISVPNQP
jgi:putative transposase